MTGFTLRMPSDGQATGVHSLDARLGRDPRPSLFELRLAERRLRARLVELDARVQGSLFAGDGLGSAEAVATVDVLCASIGELRELLDETRREIARELTARQARRARPRRWR